MIDTHVHIGCLLNDRWGIKHLESIWDYDVQEAWCSSLSGGTVSMRFGNDEMLSALEQEPRLRGLIWINPNDPDWRVMTRDYIEAGFIGFKLHPVIDRWEPSEDFLGPILELADEFGVPVFLHADHLNLIGTFLGNYSEVPFVVYHMGGFDGLWLAKMHPHVWLELSCCDDAKTQAALDAVGSKRVLYGTDAPIRLVKNAVVDRVDGQYKSYPQMGLDRIERIFSEDQQRDILEDNPRRLLKHLK